ncbi:Uncharacterised protein [uncultured archaeon]|nr:Uncharacterised protein [uncultured archaeon]
MIRKVPNYEVALFLPKYSIMKQKDFIIEYTKRDYFEGILCTLDVPSNDPPHGSNRHKIIVTTEAAQGALSTLIGAHVDYEPSWYHHNYDIVVGRIVRAWIKDGYLHVLGFLNSTLDPNVLDRIHDLNESLGMSFECQGAHVENMKAPIWRLKKIEKFTGIALLLQRRAAYHRSTFKLLNTVSS